MKNIVTVVIAIFWSLTTFAQGIEFFEGTWEEALALAAKEEKLLFVDAYAEWCGPCKRMARNVFTQDEVGDYYNKNFINLKVDMEKAENRDFSSQYPAAAFPTLYYIDFTGEVVQVIKGAQSVEMFISIGKKALTKMDRTDFYAKEYDSGNRDPKLVYSYVKALNRAGESSLKIANEYLSKQTNLQSPANLKFILEATSTADSRIFDLLIKNKSAITAVTTVQAVNERIEQACKTTLDRAIEYESEELLTDAQEKMKSHVPEKALSFELESEMMYAKVQGDKSRYIKAFKKYIKKVAKNEPAEVGSQSIALWSAFSTDKAVTTLAENTAAAAAKSDDFDAILSYATLLKKNGKTSQARTAIEEAIRIAENIGDTKQLMQAKRLMQMMR